MKTRDWLLLGGAAVVGYFLFLKPKPAPGSTDSFGMPSGGDFIPGLNLQNPFSTVPGIGYLSDWIYNLVSGFMKTQNLPGPPTIPPAGKSTDQNWATGYFDPQYYLNVLKNIGIGGYDAFQSAAQHPGVPASFVKSAPPVAPGIGPLPNMHYYIPGSGGYTIVNPDPPPSARTYGAWSGVFNITGHNYNAPRQSSGTAQVNPWAPISPAQYLSTGQALGYNAPAAAAAFWQNWGH